ncbi:MAG: transketolase C-terminal domain-containing protein [Alphaproteobacteria bacterium]
MSMRKQFVETTTRLLERDDRVCLLLGDIGVFGFRDAFARFPDRVYNIGILEQAMVGTAAGLARCGLIPIVHTIAPFLAERALEQIKLDFGYQALGGVFVTVGASYDYAALGCSHHCPGDVQVMSSIPGLDVIVPGNATEFDLLLTANYASGRPSYFRLSETEHGNPSAAVPGRATIVKTGSRATVIAVGPLLGKVLEAVGNADVSVLHYTTLAPFDRATLRESAPNGKVLVCEPYYRGALANDITEALWPRPVLLRSLGVPKRFLRDYGHRRDHDEAIGLTPGGIAEELQALLDA